MLRGQDLSNILSAMLTGESVRGLFFINHHCILLIYGELEGPRDTELGMLCINDVQMLLQKFDPNLLDGAL